MDEGYNPAYGARPLRRAIMRLLEDSMAERMLAGDIKARRRSRARRIVFDPALPRPHGSCPGVACGRHGASCACACGGPGLTGGPRRARRRATA